MHAEDIKAAIRKKGISAAQIARNHNVTNMAVSHVMHGNSKSARLASAIAQAAQLPVSQIWPGKYPQLNYLNKASPTKASAAQTKAELQQLNARRVSARKAAV